MKRRLPIIVVIAFLLLMLLLVSCTTKQEELSPLSAPQNLSVSETIIQWNEVTDAIGYIVCINEEKYPVASNMYNFANTGLKKGSYIISVIAVGDSKKNENSPASASILFEYEGAKYTLQVISEEGGTTSISKKIYDADAVVDLVAYPKEQYHFDGWFSDSFYKLSSDAGFSFKINSDTILYAQFSPDPELVDQERSDESELMECGENFAVVVYCPEEDAVSYIRNNFFVYDDYFLNDDGAIVSGYEDVATRKLGKIDSRGNNLYLITPAEAYERSGAYVARATGNVSILKEYSRIVNSGNTVAAAEVVDAVSTAEDAGIGEMAFSIENTPHVEMRLNEYVYVYSYSGNKNATSKNVDGWIVERIGTGLTDEESGTIGGFITESITIARNNHTLAVGDVVGFGGNITRDIELEQFTEDTVFGRIKSITYCGGETVYPVVFVELQPVEADSDVFAVLDVYQEGELDVGIYVEEHEEELTQKATEMFYRSDDYHRFLATVVTAAESYSQENGLALVGLTNTASFLDKIQIKPSVKREGTKIIFSIKGYAEIEFGKKDTKAIKTSGKFTVSFEFKETLKFDYTFSWIKKKWWFIESKTGINMSVITTQSTDFVFDAAVVYSANTQTGYITNENTKKIHEKNCHYVTLMKEGNKLNTTDTLEQLEQKGYTPCKACLRSQYVLDTEKKCVHRTGCFHTKQLLSDNQKPSNLALAEWLNAGYTCCGTCLPDAKKEWKDYEATEDFRKKISDSLSYTDWGDKLKEIKENYENADSIGDSSKDYQIVDFPIHCVLVVLYVRVYLTFSFKIEASVHYEHHTENELRLTVRAAIGERFQPGFEKTEKNDGQREFTLIGKAELKAGIKVEFAISDPCGLVQLGIYGTVGVYAELSGVLHLSNSGENYAAAYFELGFYYDFGVTYKICFVIKGSVSLAKVCNLPTKIPILKMGYNKVVYAYVNDIEETLVQASEVKKEFTLKELGLMKVKNFTLPKMKSGTETLDPSSSQYKVSLKLKEGKYFEIDGVNIKVKDNAPFGETFEDELTIAIRSKDTSWRTFSGDNYILYLPTITVKLVGANKCEEHVLLYLEEVAPDCTTVGYEECLMCSRCQKLFSADKSKELSARKEIAALGHVYDVLERVEPTCIGRGVTEGTICARCGEIGVSQELIDPLGHQPSETWTVVRAPKCASQGTESNRCERCSEILSYRPILPTGHKPTTHDPACEESVVCTVCEKVLASPREHFYQIVGSEDPTCVEEGFEQYRCLHCGETNEVILPATGHTDFATAKAANAVTVSVQASCEVAGEYLYHCLTCGAPQTAPIAPLGHLLSENRVTDALSGCATQGETSRHCMRKGCSYRTDVQIQPASGHDRTEWTTEKTATCVATGSRYRLCLKCGDKEVETIGALGHQYVDETTAPTCTEGGFTTHTCTRCGDVTRDAYRDALGHALSPATCTEDGVCRRCEAVLEPRLGHDFAEDSFVPATEEADGICHYSCSRCDATREDVLPMLKHEWVEDARKEATCAEEGYIKYVCHCTGGTCTATKTETIPTVSHTKVFRAAVTATCKTEGVHAHYECTACGKWFLENGKETTKDALTTGKGAHDITHYAGKAAKCNIAGYEAYDSCSRCDYTTYKVIPATGEHTVIIDAAVPPTCTKTGLTAGSHCSVCGKILVERKVVSALGHDYGDVTIDPTCTTGGYTTHTCHRCGDEYKDGNTAALGHTLTHQQAKDPTCTEAGNVEYWHCERCQKNYADAEGNNVITGSVTISKLGHKMPLTYKIEYIPCVENGEDIKGKGLAAHWSCERCGAYFTDENGKTEVKYTDLIIDARRHTWDVYEREASTCENLGFEKSRCRYCSAEKTETNAINTISAHKWISQNTGEKDCNVCGCTYNLGYEYDRSAGGWVVTGYTGNKDPSSIVIPRYYLATDEADNTTIVAPVVGIKENAFAGKTFITSITIPDTVTSIGASAFSGCTGLTSLTIPDSVTYIGENILKGCSNLEDLTLPFVGRERRTRGDAAQYPLGYLFGTENYSGAQAAKGWFFIDSVSSTAERTYYVPSSLKAVTVTGGGYLPRGAFYSCTMLQRVTLRGVTEIGEAAFCTTGAAWKEKSFELIMEGCALTFLGSYAFELNTGLHQAFEIPSGCVLGEKNPFDGCSFTEITVAEGYGRYKVENGCLIDTQDKRLIHTSVGVMTIPSEVKKIAGGAFFNRTDLTSITIPAGVASIGEYAFYGCTALTSVTFVSPESVTSIGNYAFKNCSELSVFVIPSGLTSLGKGAFEGTKLTSATIPAKVTSIGDYTFKNCKQLQSVTLPNGVKSIGKYAFCTCSTLSSVNLPSALETIGDNAFQDCTVLKSVSFPSGLKKIGSRAFSCCSTLPSITIPASVTEIGEFAFDGCGGLTEIIVDKENAKYKGEGNCLILTAENKLLRGCQNSVIPNYITVIYNSAFWKCATLTSIEIPSGVKTIDQHAFNGCTALTWVTIPSTVTSIGVRGFYDCPNLANLYFYGTESTWKAITKGSEWKKNSGTKYTDGVVVRYVSQGLAYASKGNEYAVSGIGLFDGTALVIPPVYDGKPVTSITANAFENKTKLVSVYIPNSVTSIGESVFKGCTALKEMDLPYIGNRANVKKTDSGQYPLGYLFGKVSYSGSQAAKGWFWTKNTTSPTELTYYVPTSLRTVTVRGGYLPRGAFARCTMITKVILDNGVTGVGESSFNSYDSDWKELDVTLGSGIRAIDYCAFDNNTGLKSITLPSSLQEIGNYAFRWTTLTSITIPSSVTSIGKGAFSKCSSLKEISIPFVGAKAGKTASSTYQYPLGYIFGTDAYTGGTAVKQSYYGASTDTLTEETYYVPSSLRKVTVTGGTVILRGAFYGFSMLTTVKLPEGLKAIGDVAFKNCTNLQTCNIPASVTQIGGSAFYDCKALTSVTIPKEMTGIWSYTFSGCSSLKTLTFAQGSKLTSIDEHAFFDCSALTSVVIPSKVTSIGSYAFCGCYNATVSIPASVTSIGSYAFYSSNKNVDIIIPASVTIIGPHAFEKSSAYVRFENTSGWFVTKDSFATSGTAVDVSVPSNNAVNLSGSYKAYYWKRS